VILAGMPRVGPREPRDAATGRRQARQAKLPTGRAWWLVDGAAEAGVQRNSTASTTAITTRTSNTAKTMNVTGRFVRRPSPRGLAL